MDGFLSWFFAFMTTMLGGIWQIISNLFLGLLTIFNFPVYFDQFSRYKSDFNILAWILAIFCFILVFAVWGALIFLAVLGGGGCTSGRDRRSSPRRDQAHRGKRENYGA